ncbi:MAG: inositol monophosphatase family protein [Patescibacteria group bacterium]|jgi:myo-inositol-1(or 4)-monophosphatase
MYKKELQVTQQAAKQAGKFLKKEFFTWKKKNLHYKIHNERVTWCDKQSETIIFKILKKYFPDYAILSEESGRQDKPSDYTWIIDPLDGTTNFTIHHSMFAVAIALLYKNEIVLGVIYDPILDEMYYASKGAGAFKNNQALQLSDTTTLQDSVITYCHGSGKAHTKKAYKLYKRFHDICHHCRHFGVTSLELAMIAGGKTEAHLISGAKLWDVAAGIMIIKEAGGIVTDWQNKNWHIKSKTILAANKKIHTLCLAELKKIKLA